MRRSGRGQPPVTVAIDGPAGAGKSTVAREVARRLGLALVDTGAIYRAVALLAHEDHVALDDDAALLAIIDRMQVSFAFDGTTNCCFVGQRDVTHAIRTPEISAGAARVSARSRVRERLLGLQRRLAGAGGAVLEGRDIGTVVCPAAEVKIFLDARPEERARRRHRELVAQGRPVSLQEVAAAQKERDQLDVGRLHAPLRAAPDALHLDSTRLPLQEVVEAIVVAVERFWAAHSAPPRAPDGPSSPARRGGRGA